MEETGREDAGKPCWFNSFSGGAPEETAAQARPVKQERGGGGRRGREKGSKGLKEEEEAGTKLTLRPCRMHKAKTRQETSKEIILNRQQKQMDTRRREYKREGRNKKKTKKKLRHQINALHLNSSGWS